MSHDLNGKPVVEMAAGVIMLTSRDRLSGCFFFFCRLINSHGELHSGAEKANYPGPVFSRGDSFSVFQQVRETHGGLLAFRLETLRETRPIRVKRRSAHVLLCRSSLFIFINLWESGALRTLKQ